MRNSAVKRFLHPAEPAIGQIVMLLAHYPQGRRFMQ
jgi:hypothetical protein